MKKEKWSVLAILGFIFSFLWFLSIVGVVLSAIGIADSKKNKKKGFGLALAGLIIGIVVFIISISIYITGYGIYQEVINENINIQPYTYQDVFINTPKNSVLKVSLSSEDNKPFYFMVTDDINFEHFVKNESYYYIDYGYITKVSPLFYEATPGRYHVTLEANNETSVNITVKIEIAQERI